MAINVEKNKKEFVELLQSTKRENVDYVIEDLEKLGFFDAPASAAHHLNEKGGLVQHSLNTYHAARKVWEGMCEVEPTLKTTVSPEGIIIAALLHDVCKADVYVPSKRKIRNAMGQDDYQMGYRTSYKNFPAGHGEKSVIMLLSSGLEMNDDEILAIRWHMGAWGLNLHNGEETTNYDCALKQYPLVAIIQAGDNMAANIMEVTGEDVY